MNPAQKTVESYIEHVWDRGDFERASDYVGEHYEITGVGNGPAAAAANARTFRSAFPDLAVETIDVIAPDVR